MTRERKVQTSDDSAVMLTFLKYFHNDTGNLCDMYDNMHLLNADLYYQESQNKLLIL